MGRRILAFFLGFIFAFVCIAGAIAIVVFAVKVNQMVPQSEPFLGDLSKMSVYDVGKSLYKLYADKKTWTDEEGNYFSLGDFCENYNIDLKTALGMDIPQEVLDIPAFEYFNEGGMDNAMKQIKVSALPAIVNMFGGKNEDGTQNGMFGDTVMSELAKFSLHDLLSNEEVGIAGVFANVRFADILPDAFPAEDSDNKLMWAIGQTKIGGALNGMSGGDSIFLQLKTGGAFETVGGLEITALLGESQYVSAILGSDATFADLIADDGSINFDDIINGVSVGELLGCQKHEITALDGYIAIDGQDADADKLVMQKSIGEEADAVLVYVMSENGENWYETELDCEQESQEHVHSADCFKYVWYSTTECTDTEHSHEVNGDMSKDGKWYARTDGLYAVLAGLSITDLTSGNTDALMEEIKTVKIGDIINADDVSGIMSAFVDLTIEELMNGAIDDMYLGTFFSFKREAIQDLSGYNVDEPLFVGKERDKTVLAYYVAVKGEDVALSFDRKEWFVGKKQCDEIDAEHVHTENCFTYIWKDDEGNEAEGIQGKLSSKQIGDLQYLNDEVQNMTLLDVFGAEKVPEMLKSIASVKIGELSEHIDTIQLGVLLGYEGGLICENTDETHEHKYDCYSWKDKEGNEVVGMMAKLAHKTVGDMGNLDETIKTFTMRDVLGDSVPDMLKSLADTEIGNLNDAINEMYLGDFLEYEKRYLCNNPDETHEHNANCESAWYTTNCENTDETHEHVEACYVQVEGMMAKIADKKINELNKMDEIVQELTLRDVLGDKIPPMLADVADTTVNNIGDAIEGIYLGSALSYHRKEIDMSGISAKQVANDKTSTVEVKRKTEIVGNETHYTTPAEYYKSEDGKIWYEAVETCKLDHDDHNTVDCYGYVWYEDEACQTLVDGVVKAFVNSKVGNVNQKMKTVTLGEMGIGGNTILDALQDTPIMEIGGEINDLKMGVVMGFEKRYTCGNTSYTHVHNKNEPCSFVWVEECTGNHDTSKANNHKATLTHYDEKGNVIKPGDLEGYSGKKYIDVMGLNAKIAEKTIQEMTGSGLTTIATGLTIGDLIDSGMMKLGDNENDQKENGYKLSIIYCGEESHSFTEESAIPTIPSKTYKCNLADYLTYTAAKAAQKPTVTVTAESYWLKCHGKVGDNTELSDEDIAHRDAWKTMTLANFISELLKAI